MLLAELIRLRRRAIAECNFHLHRYTNAGPWEFSPSRLRKWPTGRARLVSKFLTVWPEAIGKRLGQLRTINRKLARTCAEWRQLSDAELTEPPAYAGDDRQAHETVYFPGRPNYVGL